MKNSTKYMICEGLVVAGIILLLFFSLPGCKTVEHISHYDTVYLSKIKYDSLYFYDSIYIKEKGDTVFIDRTHFKTIYRDLIDTVYKYKVDTVKVPQIEEKVVITNELNWWQKILIYVGLVFTVITAFSIYKKIKSIWK